MGYFEWVLPVVSFWGLFSITSADFEELLSFKLKKSPHLNGLFGNKWPLIQSENEVSDVYSTKLCSLMLTPNTGIWEHFIEKSPQIIHILRVGELFAAPWSSNVLATLTTYSLSLIKHFWNVNHDICSVPMDMNLFQMLMRFTWRSTCWVFFS